MAIPEEKWGPTLQRLLPKLLELARRLAGPRMASSVVAQTVMEAYQDRHQIRADSESQVARFVNTVLRRNIYDRRKALKRQCRNPELEVPLDDLERAGGAAAGDDEGRPGAWPESEVARLERVVALLEALEQLPARERDVVVLHHAGGLTMVEIAERLGRHYDAVVRDRDRAQRTLRRLLESKGRR